MAAITATAARKELFDLIRHALRTHQPVRIRHREGEVVMLAEEDYDGLLETLELLSVAGLRASLAEAEDEIAAGQTVAFEDVLGGR